MRAYKFRIYPNKEQEVLIIKTFGSSRFVWNKMLGERIQIYEELKENKEELYSYKYRTEKQLKAEYEFLTEVDSVPLQQTRLNLTEAYKGFFRNLKKGINNGFPNFKSKYSKQSYRTLNINNNIRVDFKNKKIKLPKLEWVSYRDDRTISGKIKNVTVSKTKSGKYFVSILVDVLPHKQLPHTINTVGIDMGIKDFITTSDGETFQNLKLKRTNQSKLNKLHRNLSRKVIGSNNRNKERIKLGRYYEKLNNIKENYLHHIVNQLLNENQVVVGETLKVSNMLKNHNLARSLQELSIYRFFQILKYKAEWYGRSVVQIGQFFPSSKRCNCCGSINTELKLNNRSWECGTCGSINDRDLNAAKNILEEGIKILNKNTAGTAEIYACGDMNFSRNSAQESPSFR
jgi:putative transposase